ncbi:hypothetical protein QQP08_020500 [Theobroma cacao]|nr:hypothetical protein QQP08_020500 [Theobroma cacao]
MCFCNNHIGCLPSSFTVSWHIFGLDKNLFELILFSSILLTTDCLFEDRKTGGNRANSAILVLSTRVCTQNGNEIAR